MKVRISESGWKAGFRLCRKRPDLWRHNLLACLLTAFAVNLVSCGEKEEKKISPLGITEEEGAETAYDLDQIQEAGELIAVTLSGPDTYYEYKGKGFGLQFELAEHFAVSIGAKLRMEAVRDTAELFQRLKKGEADLIALEIPENHMTDMELQFSGVRSACQTARPQPKPDGSYERMHPSWPKPWTDGINPRRGLSCKKGNSCACLPAEV